MQGHEARSCLPAQLSTLDRRFVWVVLRFFDQEAIPRKPNLPSP